MGAPRRWAIVVLAILLSGCAARPDATSPPGSVAPGTARFTLTVDVVSAEDRPRDVADAVVSAGSAEGNVTRGEGSSVTLQLAAPQIVAVEVTAPGYAGAATVPLYVGYTPTVQDSTEALGRGLFCGLSLGLACPRDATVRLQGAHARIEVRLVPSQATREVDLAIPTTVSTPVTGAIGIGRPIAFANETDIDQLYAQQVRHFDATLAWTNAPGSEADLDLALACGTTARTSQASPATLAQMGARTLKLSLDAKGACTPWVMAWIGSASTDLTARASVVATFQAGVQTPVVE